MEKKKVNYCGSGKTANDNGTWIKASINVDKIKDFIEEYNGSRFVKLNINIKDEVDQYGKNVSISIDEFKPKAESKKQEVEELNDDLPF